MKLNDIQSEFLEMMSTHDSPTDNISVYKNNISTALTNTLKTIYPIVQAIIGDDCFSTLAAAYISNYPMRSANLHKYGEYLGDFLKDFAPLENIKYLSELAAFEWACFSLTLAADSQPDFDFKKLEHLYQESSTDIIFLLASTCALITCNYAIDEIVDLYLQNHDIIYLQNAQPIDLLLQRKDGKIYFARITHQQMFFLQCLQSGDKIEDAAEKMNLLNPHFELEAELIYWIKKGIISSCDRFITS